MINSFKIMVFFYIEFGLNIKLYKSAFTNFTWVTIFAVAKKHDIFTTDIIKTP